MKKHINLSNQRTKGNPARHLASRLIADEIRDARETNIPEDARLLLVEAYLNSEVSEIVHLALDITILTQAECLRKTVADSPYDGSPIALTE